MHLSSLDLHLRNTLTIGGWDWHKPDLLESQMLQDRQDGR
jgi:hypothetical protein